MSKERYSFCFLRYHHDMIGGEFGNVGVLLWAPDSQFLGFVCTPRYSRLSKFFLDFDADDYRGLVSRLTTQFSQLAEEYAMDKYLPAVLEKPNSARELATMVIPEDVGAIRWSKSQGGLTENPEVELAAIFEKFVEAKNRAIHSDRRNDKEVYDLVYKPIFNDEVIKPVIKPHEVVSKLANYNFDNAWKNGAWNVYETLSFDYKDSDSLEGKALTWDSRVRHLHEAEDKPKIHLLLGSARDEHKNAFNKSKDILASSRGNTGVKIIEEDEVEGFMSDLRSKVLEHKAEQA